LWRKFVELTGVVFGQSIEDLPPFGSQFQYDPAPVAFILRPRYEPSFFASLTEFDDGIVA
jgi:predicted Holliday junction resolvase-like endonuclease